MLVIPNPSQQSRELMNFVADAANPGVYTWTVGQNDNINDSELQKGSNFVLALRDPSGQVKDGGGFVNGQLQSRAFKIQSNVTTTTTTTSTTSSSTSTMPTNATSAPTVTTSLLKTHTGLSTAAKAGIGVGSAVGGIVLVAIGVGATMLCVKRSHRGKDDQRMLQSSPPNAHTAPEVVQPAYGHELHTRSDHVYQYKPLAERAQPSELHSNTRLGTEQVYHELGATDSQASNG